MKSTDRVYGWVAVAIHWLSVLLILGLFASGLTSSSLPAEAKLGVLRLHMPIGTLVLLLTLLRIVWWLLLDRERPKAVAGTPVAQDRAARAVHLLLYASIVLLAGSGLALAALSGAFGAITSGAAVAPDFWQYAPRTGHRVLAITLALLLVGHIGAALYHQMVLKDATLPRMLGRA